MKLRYVILVSCVVACSASAQNHWIKLAPPTTRNLVKVCFLDSLLGWAAGDSGAILKTTNGGGSWVSQESGITDNILDFFMLDRRHGWAVALKYPVDTSWYGTILLRTTDGGNTWSQQNHPLNFFYAVSFIDSLNGWIGGQAGRLLRSRDGGLTWSPAAVDSSIYAFFPLLHFKLISRNYGFALGGHMDMAGIVWITTNGGDRWIATNPSGEPVHGLYAIDSLNLIVVGGDYEYGSGIARTKDGGHRWEYTYLFIWGEARALAFRTSSEGYAPLGFADTYMVTSDTGRTWSALYTPDSSAVYDVTFTDSTHGFMVGERGTILKYSTNIVSVTSNSRELPTTPSLYQNYPNPFNPTTSISYRLSTVSYVVLKVYDAVGREVKTLVKGNQEAGVHQVEFDGEGFASGVYYYELTTGKSANRSTQVRKMILLR